MVTALPFRTLGAYVPAVGSSGTVSHPRTTIHALPKHNLCTTSSRNFNNGGTPAYSKQ